MKYGNPPLGLLKHKSVFCIRIHIVHVLSIADSMPYFFQFILKNKTEQNKTKNEEKNKTKQNLYHSMNEFGLEFYS